jgi:hypothetical protein
MNIHEYTWVALGCRSNSCICQRYINLTHSARLNHVGVTTMNRLDQGHLHLVLKIQRQTCPDGESWEVREYPRKEPLEQLVDSYSEHLHMSLRQYHPIYIVKKGLRFFRLQPGCQPGEFGKWHPGWGGENANIFLRCIIITKSLYIQSASGSLSWISSLSSSSLTSLIP